MIMTFSAVAEILFPQKQQLTSNISTHINLFRMTALSRNKSMFEDTFNIIRFPSRVRYDLMTQCWDVDPRQRPSFVELIESINDVIKTLQRRPNDDVDASSGLTQYANSPTSDTIAADYLVPTSGALVSDHPSSTDCDGQTNLRQHDDFDADGLDDEDDASYEEEQSLYARRRKQRGRGELTEIGVVCAAVATVVPRLRLCSVDDASSYAESGVGSPSGDLRIELFGELERPRVTARLSLNDARPGCSNV